MVRGRLGNLKGLRVLEVGCGRGAFAIELARSGARVTALDVSTAAIEVARQRAERANVDVDWLVSDARSIGLPDASFDLVVSCECLEHVLEPEAMALELFRLCRPGGRCLLTTPSYLNGYVIAWIMSWILSRPFNSGAGVQPHESFFLFFRVRKMLKMVGFRVIAEDSRIFQWLLLPRVAPAKLRVVAFRYGWQNRLARPFGLHFLFDLSRPNSKES
jgi:2-polyprenyl-3-methyl-5-hydroxy-6-metoxy-1,4-benzoquinol methylase